MDMRQFAPATERNRQPILDVLHQVLPPVGAILEVSSGTGEHAVFLAPRLAPRLWIPSDPDPVARASIAAWRSHQPAANLCSPLALDAREQRWPVELENPQSENPQSENPQSENPQFENSQSETAQPSSRPSELETIDLEAHPIRAIVNINMIHIAPWSACVGLMAGAARILPTSGILYLYGPYKRDGAHTAPSNAAFDQSLRSRNPEWGIRDLGDVVSLAQQQHLTLLNIYEMPANNLSVVFQKN